jgi:hypothetical protein
MGSFDGEGGETNSGVDLIRMYFGIVSDGASVGGDSVAAVGGVCSENIPRQMSASLSSCGILFMHLATMAGWMLWRRAL